MPGRHPLPLGRPHLEEDTVLSDKQLISIVIPTHNRPERLIEALDSVARQQYRPLELIIVDDGSEPAARDAARRWADENHGDSLAVHYFHQEQQGPAAARNRGLLESRGEYVQFMDDDHLMAADTLEHLVEALPGPDIVAVSVASHQNVHATDSASTTGERTAPPAYDNRKVLLEKLVDGRWFVPMSGYLFTRAAIAKVGEWNTKIRYRCEDELLIRAAVQAVGFIAAPAALVYQRDHDTHPAEQSNLHQRIRDNIQARERAARELTMRGAIQTYQPAFNSWYRGLVERYGNALDETLADKPSALIKWASR